MARRSFCADQVVYDETTKDALAVGHVTLIGPTRRSRPTGSP